MKTSANGLAFIAREEGEVLHVYVDSVGVQTIGVGHALRKGESFPNGITHEQAMAILASDVILAENAVNADVKVPMTQNQFDALVSFTFNLGTGSLASSTLLKLLNAGDTHGAADEFLKWVKGGGKVLPGLVGRRQRERDLFLKDMGTVTPPVVVPTTQAGDKLASVIKKYVGCSLKNRRAELGKLVARGVDDPESVVTISTNCATTALGVMAEAGVKHPLLTKKYVNGMAIAWVRQVGMDLKALVKYTGPTGPQPKVGSLLRFNTAGTNNDHVEWLLSPIAADGTADHAGGGRADNAITLEHGNVLSSYNRPLVEFWDPDKLFGAVVVAPEPPHVTPPPKPVVVPPPVPKPTPEVVKEPEPKPIVTTPEVVAPVAPPPAPIVPVPPPAPQGIIGFIMMIIQMIISAFSKSKS